MDSIFFLGSGDNQTNSERQMYLLKTMAGNTEITPIKKFIIVLVIVAGNVPMLLGKICKVLPVNFQDSSLKSR